MKRQNKFCGLKLFLFSIFVYSSNDNPVKIRVGKARMRAYSVPLQLFILLSALKKNTRVRNKLTLTKNSFEHQSKLQLIKCKNSRITIFLLNSHTIKILTIFNIYFKSARMCL